MTNRLLRMVLLLIIRAYQLGLSPLIGPACRYDPSCSQYAREAIARHGARAGVALAARRVLRCHPWHPGGHDPVPDELPVTRHEMSCVTRA